MVNPAEARIMRTTSKLNPPSTYLDKILYVVVISLWLCVAGTWSTTRSRLLHSRMTTKLAETNGRRGALREIDWWKTGQAKLRNSPGIEASPSRRLGKKSQDQTYSAGAAVDSAEVSAESSLAQGGNEAGVVPGERASGTAELGASGTAHGTAELEASGTAHRASELETSGTAHGALEAPGGSGAGDVVSEVVTDFRRLLRGE